MNRTPQESIAQLLTHSAVSVDRRLEGCFARRYSAEEMTNVFGEPRFEHDSASFTETIARPVWHCLSSGGKRWRAVLMMLLGEALGGPLEVLEELTVLVEGCHNGSLLADDIEDDSPLRRGVPSVHRALGIDVAVNASGMMYFLPLRTLINNTMRLSEAHRLAIYDVYAEAMIRLHAGQALDIAWHNGFRVPSIDQYLQMCAFKTGGLVWMGARVAAIVGGAPSVTANAVAEFAETIALGFQIQDDILNVTHSALAQGKGYGEDIHEGKKTLIVVHSLSNVGANERNRLLKILSMHTHDTRLIDEAIDLLKATNSIEFASLKARSLVEQGWERVDPYLQSGPARDRIYEFSRFLVERDL